MSPAGPLISIVTTGHDVADARLHREVAALIRIGLDVEVLGLGDIADGPAGASVRTWQRAGGLRRAWYAVTLPWRARGAVVMTLDPDAAAGAWLRRSATRFLPKRRRVRVVADVHEDYRLVLHDRAWAVGPRALGGRIWAVLGEQAARGADLVVVADHHLLPGLTRRLVLPNTPDRTMLPGKTVRDATPRAVYIGDLRRSRGLFTMLDMIESSPGWTLDLVGPIAPADRSTALSRLERLENRVRWHDRLPPRQAWNVAAGAWTGLALLEDTPAFRGSVPSKLYEYLACGLAVITTDLPRSASLVEISGAGAVVEDGSHAAQVLRAWSDNPALVDAFRASAWAWADEHVRDESAEFAAAVHRLAG